MWLREVSLKSPCYPSNMRPGGTGMRSECGGEEGCNHVTCLNPFSYYSQIGKGVLYNLGLIHKITNDVL
jgi:hypothetical protein